MKAMIYSLFALICITALQVHAVDGGGYNHGNGGDICELRFKSVRDDLVAWINKGGAKDLRLPPGISHQKYSQNMLDKMQSAKISCVAEKLLVGRAEKTCKNFVEKDGSLNIQCNKDRFMATSGSDQYILVHHEYAGLAGFEVNTGEDSNYEISNQIIRNLVSIRMRYVKTTLQFIAKLANTVEKTPNDRARKNSAACMFIGRINEGDITQELYRQLVSLDIQFSGDHSPVGNTLFSKLRINIMGLMNYCYEGFVQEDPQPLHFDDLLALVTRIQEIQQQMALIDNYLDQRFPIR